MAGRRRLLVSASRRRDFKPSAVLRLVGFAFAVASAPLDVSAQARLADRESPPPGHARWSNGALEYRHTIVAPSACYEAGEQTGMRVSGDALVIERALLDVPGFCIQSLVEIVFEGAVHGLSPMPTQLQLDIRGPNGEALDTIVYDIAD